MEEKFAGGKFREIPLAVDIIFAGGKFRAKSKFAKIAKLNSTRKIGVIQYYQYSISSLIAEEYTHAFIYVSVIILSQIVMLNMTLCITHVLT